MKRPSQRPKHTRTANAVVALLDAAWNQRQRGRRADMRGLARSAVALARYFDQGRPCQLNLGL